ncbi:AraC family transcriptional regulator [Kushneria marisflavi]|uniref:AraC family transcriptional regulator n=1 Tax=Kushneria marisflavi TaxID=157779 RepID=A0A240UQ42_9GAMM|nr:AraC family transcriptional regulator [Kushneria marisflavi]ART63235.1 AraC family transcriptional regulator [Kushneria marisflavi]RKD84264.1 AraC family transcriptional regulator [Kushneria marisflavi]
MNHAFEFQFSSSRHVPTLKVLSASISDFRYDRHAHTEYAFGVTLAGRQDFFSAGAYHRNPPGNVIFFNPEQPHDGESGGDHRLDYVMTYIAPGAMAPLFAEAAGNERADRLSSPQTLIHDPVLRDAILALSRLVREGVGSLIDQEHLLQQIATRMVQRAGHYQPVIPTETRPDRLLMRACDYIRAHLDQELSLARISEAATLSRYHFLRLFRAQFGMTPHQYVISCRIDAARGALESGATPGEVALRYGFADHSHFNRRFKRIHGITPFQYQQSLAH